MPLKLSPRDYTIAWICPLELEQIPALLMLDELHESLQRQPAGDNNSYCLGHVGSHNVVIARLPRTSNSSAATLVTQLRRTFYNVKFGLLVGIGGGVPVTTDEGEIRLGDIVVSYPQGDLSGVVEYDHGKTRRDSFEHTGALAPPPIALLSAAQTASAMRKIKADEDPILTHLTRINVAKTSLRKYKFPGVERDMLYPAYVQHRDPTKLCHQCECGDALIPRPDDRLYEHSIIHWGPIGSGGKVMKDASKRDELAELGFLCFDTEAAGVATDFPCLVIRGISDYADSHKNDIWQGYAAAVAAAFAREVFEFLPCTTDEDEDEDWYVSQSFVYSNSVLG